MLVEEPRKRANTDGQLVFNPNEKNTPQAKKTTQHSPQPKKTPKAEPVNPAPQSVASYVYQRAAFWRRTLAVLINLVLLFLFMVLGGVLIDNVFPHVNGGIQVLMTYLPYFAVQLWFVFRYGQTIGKRLLGLYVLHAETGEKIGVFHYLMREGYNLTRLINPFLLVVTLFSDTYVNSIVLQKVAQKT